MGAFGRLLRLETRRGLGSPAFKIALAVATLMAVCTALILGFSKLQMARESAQYLDSQWVSPFAQGAYTLWLPMVAIAQLPGLFFIILPLLCATAYSWSLRADLDSGYASSLVTRASAGIYYASKSCATFICGGLIASIPLLANFLTLLCVIPAYIPSVVDATSTGIWFRTFMSSLFFTNPPAYMAVRTMLDFLLGGLWSCAVLAVSQVMRSKLAAIVFPVLVIMTVQNIWTTVASLRATVLGIDQTWSSITILDHLRSRGDALYYDGWALAFDIAILVLIIVIGAVVFSRRELR